MSDKCSNCDCNDSSQCTKKGNSYGVVIVDAEKSHFEMAEVAYENDGKCKCTTGCTCAGCTCGK
uniref:Metallothionein n=1 Tax=Leersia perrieri TaxID=77586 RepID=A0A0D9WDR4_9ORYZ